MEDFLNILQTHEYPVGKAAMSQAEKEYTWRAACHYRASGIVTREFFFFCCERSVLMRCQFNARELN